MLNDQKSPAFWNHVARRYAGMAVRNPAAYEATLDRVCANLQPQDRILEFGCGTGATAQRLAPLVGHYTATDYSAKMIAIACEKQAEAEINNLDFHITGAGEGTTPEGAFDAVLAFNILHLLPDRRRTLDDTLRNLRPGGLFISKTSCLGGIYRILQPVVAALRLFGKAPSLNFLTPASLQRELTDYGFEIREYGDYPARLPSRFIVAIKT
jgi:SAM-dependent methyltransferase